MAQEAQTNGPQALVNDMLTGQTRLNKPGDVKFLSDIVKQASVAADVAGAMVLAERPDSLPTLKTITVTTLILEGVEDTVYPPPFAMKMQQNIAGSKMVLIPGAHAAIYENAPLANPAILDWARSNNLK